MAVVNLSLPDEFLKKVDRYKEIQDINRSEFFKRSAELYFKKIEEGLLFKRKKEAMKKLMKIGEDARKEGTFKGIDLVEEIRKMRKERTDELLRRSK
ncbi:MAG: hypothetical protein ACQEP5_06475 [Actinomycetota bacterium]